MNGTFSYLGTDGLGSPTLALDGAGNVQASVLYGPYGTKRYSSGVMPGSYGYTGQRADGTTGLDYYNARYYDPVPGQFASADTARDGLNRYGYVHGNSTTLSDPTGHIGVCPNTTSGCVQNPCQENCSEPTPPTPCQENCSEPTPPTPTPPTPPDNGSGGSGIGDGGGSSGPSLDAIKRAKQLALDASQYLYDWAHRVQDLVTVLGFVSLILDVAGLVTWVTLIAGVPLTAITLTLAQGQSDLGWVASTFSDMASSQDDSTWSRRVLEQYRRKIWSGVGPHLEIYRILTGEWGNLIDLLLSSDNPQLRHIGRDFGEESGYLEFKEAVDYSMHVIDLQKYVLGV